MLLTRNNHAQVKISLEIIFQMLTDHHLGMDVDYEPPRLLSSAIVCIWLRPLLGRVLVAFLHLSIPQVEEGKVVPRVCSSEPLGSKSLRYIYVHHFHRPSLLVQDGLNSCALRDALWPHRYDNVNGEPLPSFDLADHLQ